MYLYANKDDKVALKPFGDVEILDNLVQNKSHQVHFLWHC